MKNVVVVIMAGGLGKRMESKIPKVLHKINGLPMICHILLKLKLLANMAYINKILIVVGKYKDIIKDELDKYDNLPGYDFVIQPEPLGTGNAIQCSREELLNYPDSDVLILSGDVPLLQHYTMYKLLTLDSEVKLITTMFKDPTGYGRIIIKNGKFEKIVEQKDCNKEELLINSVNCGIYSINSRHLCKYLPYLKNNNLQNEYYLTDIIEIINREENIDVGMLEIPQENSIEITGINTDQQLKELENQIFKNKIENL